jgi:hypothetical protein
LRAQGANGAAGALRSLSASARLVLGAPFVCNVTTPSPPGRVTAPGAVVDILVAFSEPVRITCGGDNLGWVAAPGGASRSGGGAGALFASCPLVTLALVTAGDRSLVGNQTAVLVSSTLAQLAPGADGPPDAPALLRFRYVVRPFDATAALQYASVDALGLAGGATVVRVRDGAPAGTRLPPTRYDAGVDNPASLAGTRTIVIAATG